MNAQVLATLTGWPSPTAPRLADALDLLDGKLVASPAPAGSVIDRLGGRVRWRLRQPVTAGTLRRLRMAGRSVDSLLAPGWCFLCPGHRRR